MSHRTFSYVIQNRNTAASSGEARTRKSVSFVTEMEEKERYSKAFTGVIKNLEEAKDLKSRFHKEVLFSIRLTTLGPNL